MQGLWRPDGSLRRQIATGSLAVAGELARPSSTAASSRAGRTAPISQRTRTSNPCCSTAARPDGPSCSPDWPPRSIQNNASTVAHTTPSRSPSRAGHRHEPIRHEPIRHESIRDVIQLDGPANQTRPGTGAPRPNDSRAAANMPGSSRPGPLNACTFRFDIREPQHWPGSLFGTPAPPRDQGRRSGVVRAR